MTTALAALILVGAGAPGPKVDATSAIILDANTGKVLWARDANTPRYPASTTKIATALLLIERTLPTDVVTAPPDVETITGASLHLQPGEKLTASDLLTAIMLRSANDACYTAAIHISGSVEKFAQLMNQRARQAGAKNPQFHNPHGLNDPEHKISAYDLAMVTREAMRYPTFNEVVKKRRATIQRPSGSKDTYLVSKNKWLDMDPTADGVKTGWTVPSGHCYVGSATREGFRVVTVILGAKDWVADHSAMLDWAYSHWELGFHRREGAKIALAPVRGGAERTVGGVLGETITMLRRKGSTDEPQVAMRWTQTTAPVRVGQKLGVAKLTDAEGFEVETPVFAANTVSAAPPVATAGISSPWALCGLAALASASLARRRRPRRGRYQRIA